MKNNAYYINKRDSWYAKWYDDVPATQKITRKGAFVIAAACRLHNAQYPDQDGEYSYVGAPIKEDGGYAEDLRYIPDLASFIEASLLMKGQVKRAVRHAHRAGDTEKRIKIMGRIMSEPMFVSVR